MNGDGSKTVPIAIVGMSCRFAGDATDPEKLWSMLREGRNAWSEIPSTRFNLEGWYHPNRDNISTTSVRGGHFLEEDLALFDAPFFNLSAETAATLDPQYRLLLEIVYEALENAGITLQRAAGSSTSVFSGAFFHDYQDGLMRDTDSLPRFLMTGNGSAMASNRVSHFFDLQGPSMTIDTGCSTTLTALHQACQSLRAGDSDMSIVGGSNLLINPDFFISISSLGMLSPDGKSYSFDSRANGYGRGEGVASLVIKRLDDAVKAGDPIRAVIRETQLNQDGKTETITSPSPEAQERLIRSCYQRAGIDPRSVQYFEAHGTGTPTGDPIEARAIASVFQKGRSDKDRLYVGSVKTNLGHTEPTSGLASVIKVALALEHGVIPPSVNFEQPNKRLQLDDWHLKIPQECEHWPLGADGTRRASVNNFGYGGANAHVIMEGWTPSKSRKDGVPNGSVNGNSNGVRMQANAVNVHTSGQINGVNGHTNGVTGHANGLTNGLNLPSGSGQPNVKGRSRMFVLSAKDEHSCQAMASNLKEYLQRLDLSSVAEGEDQFLDGLAYTLSDHRSRFSWVSTFTAASVSELITALDNSKLRPGRAGNAKPRVGFVFTGQGAQWYAMGRELIDIYPVFRASLLEAEGYLNNFGYKWSLIEELSRDAATSRVSETAMSLPLCTALQISLVNLLEAWGITPVAISSHSSGEIAAAYTIRALSFQAAMAACSARSAVSTGLQAGEGGMLAVGLGVDATEAYLEQVKSGKACVACHNSPSSVTVSGDLAALDHLEAMLKEQNVFVRRLHVRTAFHSHHMQPGYEPYIKEMRSLGVGKVVSKLQPIIYASPTTGRRMNDAAEIGDPIHWANSMVNRVQFAEAFRGMTLDPATAETEVDAVLEVGPHAALSGPIGDLLATPDFQDSNISYHSCLIRKTSAVETMQTMAGQLLQKGFPVDLKAINFPCGQENTTVLSSLPPYPWNHQTRHWAEPRVNRAHRDKKFQHHDLLGSLVKGTNSYAPTWRHVIRPSEVPWVRDHTVQSNMVYPGAGYICMAIEAACQLSETANDQVLSGYRLRDVDIEQALVIPDGSDGVEVQIMLLDASDKAIGVKGWKVFQIFSVGLDNTWTEHCRGLIQVLFRSAGGSADRRNEIGPLASPKHLPSYSKNVDPQDIFAGMRSVGIYHGPVFQNMEAIQVTDKRAVSNFSIADVVSTMPAQVQHEHVMHPTTLDSVFVSAYSAILGPDTRQNNPKVPKSIKNLWVSSHISSQPGHKFESYADVQRDDAKSFQASISLVDATSGDKTPQDPVLVMEGFVCQSLGAAMPQETDPYRDDICSTLKWVPDVSFMDLGLVAKELSLPIAVDEAKALADLQRACFHYINDALEALTASDVRNLEWHHKRFYTWMKLQAALAHGNDLGPNSSKWINDTAEEKAALLKSVQSGSVNGEVVVRLGPHITEMLRREVTPLELLMENKLLYRYYCNGLKWDRSNVQLSEVAKYIVYQNPRAKILEVGGGTGGATRRVLDKIGNGKKSRFGPFASEYHFTDVSSGFFAEAQEQFSDWSDIMTYKKLDIEADPEKQGFECGSYDLIVACQVLHATKCMDRTLAHVRRLLKPGGKLLLVETTKDQMDMNFTFGLLPGWWLSEEEERSWGPNMPVAYWQRILKKAGFSGIDLDLHDCDNKELYSFSVLQTTAVLEDTQTAKPAFDPITLVTGNGTRGKNVKWIAMLQASIAAITDGALPEVEPMESVNSDGKICIFLGELHGTLLKEPSSAEFAAIRALALNCKALVWVTRGGAVDCSNPELSLSAGFLRSLRQENTGKKYITVDLDPARPTLGDEDASVIAKVLAAVLEHGNAARDFEFAERDGAILLPRMHKDFARNSFISTDAGQSSEPRREPFSQTGRLLQLDVGTPGLLETLAFGDMPEVESVAPEYIEIEPKAFGLNFRDVMAAMGQLNEKVMGLECAGVVTRVGTVAASQGFKVGDAVFALLTGQYTSRAQVPWIAACQMPAGLDFETAASIPMVFVTAYISLYEKARLCKGQSVLIHAATGGVGQAAIMLAQLVGAEIFATAGTPEKRQHIMTTYGLPADHVFSSRDTLFMPKVKAMTGGRGVDAVLNSLSGPLLQESFNCLAPFGHFLEIGKFDLERNNHLEMVPFSHAVSFTAIDVLALLRMKSLDIHRALTSVARLIDQKVVRPVGPITSLPLADIERAYRQMQAGKHMGKIVLSVGKEEIVPVTLRGPTARLRPDASYLIAGGVGGIGRSAAQWMLSHGARNLILASRSAAAGGRTAVFVAELQEAHPDAKIKAIGCDISNKHELATALQACVSELPPVRGVLQAAMVLDDNILENMSLANYNAAVRPKVQGSWNLHEQLGADLDFFIMLSSIAGIFGQASQSNYSAGGAFQDALARNRVHEGLPGVTIDVGAVKDVGYVASNPAVLDRMIRAGHRLLSEGEILSAIESAIVSPCAQIMIGINTGPSAAGLDSLLAREARFDALRYQESANAGTATGGLAVGGKANLAAQLAGAASHEEAVDLVMKALGKKLVDIFMIPEEEVIPSKSLANFGVDSLVAVELRNMLALQAAAEVSIFDILQSPSLAALSSTVASKSAAFSVAA